jgi:hypothetical protein
MIQAKERFTSEPRWFSKKKPRSVAARLFLAEPA